MATTLPANYVRAGRLAGAAVPSRAKTLLEMRLPHRDIGQLIVSTAVVHDIVGWLLLSVVSALATTGLATRQLALSIVSLVAVLLVTLTLGRPVVNATLRLAGHRTDPGPTIAAVVVLLLLAAAGSHAAGMEPVLGTLLIGILIGSSGRVHLSRLAPLRTFVMAVLAPIYFATAGLNARGVIEVIVAMVGLRLGVLTTAAPRHPTDLLQRCPADSLARFTDR